MHYLDFVEKFSTESRKRFWLISFIRMFLQLLQMQMPLLVSSKSPQCFTYQGNTHKDLLARPDSRGLIKGSIKYTKTLLEI